MADCNSASSASAFREASTLSAAASDSTIKIQAVLALYRCAFSDSPAWQSLLAQLPASGVELHLLIAENDLASDSACPELPEWVEYAAIRNNHGIAWMYELGRERAHLHGAEWLLTLDQDSELPWDLLARYASTALSLGTQPTVAAIVPQLVNKEGRVHSPSIIDGMHEQRLPSGWTGLAKGELRAFNSAAMIRIAALDAIGGYDRRFWLDSLDHATFAALFRHGYKVWVAGDLSIVHSLSIHDAREAMTEGRFRGFLAAESAFRDLSGSWLEGASHTLRLAVRLLRQTLRGDPPHFRRATAALFWQRLLKPRSKRVQLWEKSLQEKTASPDLVRRCFHERARQP